jgi:hypothetical protein
MKTANRLSALASVLSIVLIGLAEGREEPAPFGPVISRIEVKNGSAWDVVEQIRSGLPKDSPTGFAVEIPEADLRKVRIGILDLRSVPLGLALHYLYQATRAVSPSFEGGMWILRPMTFDGPSGGLAIQIHEISEDMLKLIGIDYRKDAGLFDADGNSWPEREGWVASFQPRSKQLILRADTSFQEEIAALLLLVKRGYTGLEIKPHQE